MTQTNIAFSIRKEIAQYIVDNIGYCIGIDSCDLHNALFNESYYMVYNSEAIKWLAKHELDAFEAIEIVQEYEKDNFGESNTAINPEAIVNMLAYIVGHDTLTESGTYCSLDGRLTEEDAAAIKAELTTLYEL